MVKLTIWLGISALSTHTQVFLKSLSSRVKIFRNPKLSVFVASLANKNLVHVLWGLNSLFNFVAFCLLSSDDGWSSSARSGHGRDYDDRRRRDYSPEDRRRGGRGTPSGLQGRRSHSRDDLMDMERNRRYGGGGGDTRGGRDDYDDSFLREAMERKKMGEQQRARSRDRLDSESDRSDRGRAPRGPPPLPQMPPSGYPGRRDDYPPPLPPPYSDNESVSSSKKSNLRKVSHSKTAR